MFEIVGVSLVVRDRLEVVVKGACVGDRMRWFGVMRSFCVFIWRCFVC